MISVLHLDFGGGEGNSPLHQKKRKVMKRPPQHAHAHFIIEPLKHNMPIIPTTPLPPQHRQPLERHIGHHRGRGAPPDQGISNQINLSMILPPEINPPTQYGPRSGARVPRVTLHQPGIRRPHDTLQFPELREEAEAGVVHFLRLPFAELRVRVPLHVPHAVGQRRAARARDFLLFEAPFGKFDFVREEDAAGHEVHKFEFRLDGADASAGEGGGGEGGDDLYPEEVVRIAFETIVAVGRDFVLPVGFGERRADVVGVQAAVGRDVVEADDGAIMEERGRGQGVPGQGAWDGCISSRVGGPVDGLGLVLHDPDVVLVLVRVEGDLLLLGAGGVHVGVGVQVATLRVVVPERDAGAEGNVGGHVGHGLAVERGLELGRHEAVAVARVDEAEEVDGEECHVDGGGDDDQAEDAGEQVLEPDARRHVRVVAEQDPQLQSGEGADPSNGEEANPFDACSGTEAESGGREPEPPVRGECAARA